MEVGWNRPNSTGLWLFMAGAWIGFLLFFASFIQDTESLVFAALASGDDTLRTMSCPEIITKGETGKVSATISNKSDKRLYRHVRTFISEGFLTMRRQYDETFYLDPGESKKLTWEVESSDAAWGYVVMAKVYVFKANPYPSYVGTCGITALNLPYVKGWHLVAGITVISMAMMAVGYRRYILANRPLVQMKRKPAKNMQVIAVTVLVGILVLFFEIFIIELALFVFTIILLAESIFEFSKIEGK